MVRPSSEASSLFLSRGTAHRIRKPQKAVEKKRAWQPYLSLMIRNHYARAPSRCAGRGRHKVLEASNGLLGFERSRERRT